MHNNKHLPVVRCALKARKESRVYLHVGDGQMLLRSQIVSIVSVAQFQKSATNMAWLRQMQRQQKIRNIHGNLFDPEPYSPQDVFGQAASLVLYQDAGTHYVQCSRISPVTLYKRFGQMNSSCDPA